MYLPNILLAVPRNSVTALGLPLALGFFSGSQTSSVTVSNWYHSLRSPPGQPPRTVFPFVWTLLYLSMGYASHIAVKALDTATFKDDYDSLQMGFTLYFAQLALNFVWSPLFFGARQTGLALIDSVLLMGTTLAMTVCDQTITVRTAVLKALQRLWDRPTNAQATWFLLPYCAWLGYATYLNAGIWWLNRKPNGSRK